MAQITDSPVPRHSLRLKSDFPLTIHQFLSLFGCQGRHTINGTCYLAHPFHSKVAGRVSNRKLWLRIRPCRRWSMKVRRDNWTSQPTELKRDI